MTSSAPALRPPLIPVGSLQRLLVELPGCVVLRNDDVVANLRRGGDIDLLVSDLDAAERQMVGVLGAPRTIIRHSYVIEYLYDWGHIDVSSTLEWWGARYLPTAMVIQQANASPNSAARPRLAHEALICWLSSLLWGGFFKERYADLIVSAAREDGEAFRAACRYAAGDHWGDRLWTAAAAGRPGDSVKWVTAVRRAVWWHALRRDTVGTVRRCTRFWSHEIGLRRRPPLPSFAFLGADGSGKSSVLSAVALRFAPPSSKGVVLCHWRPGRLGGAGDAAGPVTDPHGKPPRGALASVLKLGFLVADWTIGYWGGLVHRRAKGQLLAFDRHFVDIHVDPARYRYGGPRWLAALAGAVIPAADVLIVLDAPVETLRQRKQEVSEDETRRQRQAYRELARNTRSSYIVDAGRPLSEVVDEVERIIVDRMKLLTLDGMRPRGLCPPGAGCGLGSAHAN